MGTQKMVVTTLAGRFLMAGVATITALFSAACSGEPVTGQAINSPLVTQYTKAADSGGVVSPEVQDVPIPDGSDPVDSSKLAIKGMDLTGIYKAEYPYSAQGFVGWSELGTKCFALYASKDAVQSDPGRPSIKVYGKADSTLDNAYYRGDDAAAAASFLGSVSVSCD